MAKWKYNPETLLYEKFDEPAWQRAARVGVFVLGIIGVVCLNFWLYVSVFGWELPKTAALRKENTEWKSRLEVMNRRIDVCEQILGGIEDRDDDVYRAIYGLGELSSSIRLPGYDGINRYSFLESHGASSDLMRTTRRLDMLEKRTYIQSMALDEVGDIARQAGDMVSCVPSVPPILPAPGTFSLSSPFGFRTDPVYGGGEFHKGQDIATRRGNPVYATGDGVVELAEFQFNGYGNEVIINHGYGYKTLYAHLNTIEVVAGMKLKRGDRIGTVGSSGKSTGTHLHYEVFYRGNRVNPMQYMDMGMSVDEYREMVRKRREDSPYDKRSSTTELIRRRRDKK